MSKLFNIGDSFAVGNCIDSFNSKTDFHLSPGGLIAEFFNLDELNYAKNGNSFDGILKDLYTLDFTDCSLISVCTPPATRIFVRTTTPRPIDKELRIPRLNKLLSKFPGLKLSQDTIDAVKYAFSYVPRPKDMPSEHRYFPCSWLTIINAMKPHMSSKSFLDNESQILYWQTLNILSIQTRLKALGIPYIIWNGMSSLPPQIQDSELAMLRSMIDESYFFRPEFKLWDLIINNGNPDDINHDFAIHHDDSHPNHKCYYFWFDMLKQWMIQSGSYSNLLVS